MRRIAAIVALLLAGACGGSTPTSPAPVPVSLPRPIVLASGTYTLALSVSSAGLPVCENGVCVSLSFCSGTPSSATMTWSADVERIDDRAIVRSLGAGNTLVLTLTVATESVTGTITGVARDAGGQMVAASGSVTGWAAGNAGTTVSGTIDGQMTVGGGWCSNNGHVWSLSPR
jgi:hypothetical protein